MIYSYQCPVCWVNYTDYDSAGVQCEQCGCKVCPECIDVSGASDICDKCADEMSETEKGLTEHQLADKLIDDLKSSNCTYEDMAKVFEIARQKYRRLLEIENKAVSA